MKTVIVMLLMGCAAANLAGEEKLAYLEPLPSHSLSEYGATQLLRNELLFCAFESMGLVPENNFVTPGMTPNILPQRHPHLSLPQTTLHFVVKGGPAKINAFIFTIPSPFRFFRHH